jgi:adenine C2-methylase RlmN of 23S rRNA A2503 and tRNA A37
MKKTYLLDLEPAELEEIIAGMGEPKFRAKQIIKWAYEKKVASFEQCSDLSREFREKQMLPTYRSQTAQQELLRYTIVTTLSDSMDRN